MANPDSSAACELEAPNSLFADTPLTNPQNDRLGYASFARHLADSICKMNVPGGFVIAVYGAWGLGKSTLLNFLVHYLKEKPEDERPVIIPFNPWLFSGDEDLTRRFINQLETSLSQLKSVPQGFKTRITNLIKAISEIPVPYAQAGKAVVRLFDPKQRDTAELKEDLEDKLDNQHPRVVVTIDDIDKLAANDIAQLFRLLKAIPNFTNVVYVLAFHKDRVAKALAETQSTAGIIDFDSMIQAAFELPLPDKTLLRRLLFEKLSSIFADARNHEFKDHESENHQFDPIYWGNIYFQGIDYFIANPHDIVRLTNALTVSYPVVKDEVNLVDLIAIESMRVFQPKVYDIIRKHPSFFAGYVNTQDSATAIDNLKQFHNAWLAQLNDEDKEPTKQLLFHLFPKLQTVYQNKFYSSNHELIWRQHLRICSLEVFPVYFRLTLPTGECPDTEIKAMLAIASGSEQSDSDQSNSDQLTSEQLAAKLLELAEQNRSDGNTQIRSFLEQIELYTATEISINAIPAIVQAFFDVGDYLLEADEPHGLFDFGNDDRIIRIVWQLLSRLSEPERFETLKDAISTGRALSLIKRTVAILAQKQAADATNLNLEVEQLISQEHSLKLEEAALQRLQTDLKLRN